MASLDVRILGAGIFGLSIAWACTRAGARVEIVDPNGPAAGASGGLVGALAPHVPENWNAKKQFQFESLIQAETFWSEVAEVAGTDPGYRRSGRIQPIMDVSGLKLARERGQNVETLWPHAGMSWSIVDGSCGWGIASPTGQFIFDSLSAQLPPRQACLALAEALRLKGADLRRHQTSVEASATVWCTGAAGLADLSRSVGKDIGTAIKGQAVSFDCSLGEVPQLFFDGLHFIAHPDGKVSVGSTTEREFQDAQATDALLDDLVSRARGLIPDLQDAPIAHRWAGLRPRARCRAPILGPWPRRPRHFVANGGFKIGFGMAPKVGDVMSALVLEGRDTIPAGFHVEDNL